MFSNILQGAAVEGVKVSGGHLWMLLCEEPKEFLALCIHHQLVACEDLLAVSQMAVQVNKDIKSILGRPALVLLEPGSVYKSAN